MILAGDMGGGGELQEVEGPGTILGLSADHPVPGVSVSKPENSH